MKQALYLIGLAASVSLLIPVVFILILWASQ
jgi:hypothetical protein